MTFPLGMVCAGYRSESILHVVLDGDRPTIDSTNCKGSYSDHLCYRRRNEAVVSGGQTAAKKEKKHQRCMLSPWLLLTASSVYTCICGALGCAPSRRSRLVATAIRIRNSAYDGDNRGTGFKHVRSIKFHRVVTAHILFVYVMCCKYLKSIESDDILLRFINRPEILFQKDEA